MLYAWWAGTVAPGDVDLPQTINLLIMAVIGGLVRIEGAWIGAFVFFVMQNYITTSTHVPLLGFGGTLFGGSFNTIIGIIFLVIVLISPDGLLGIWDWLWRRGSTGTPAQAAEPPKSAEAASHELKVAVALRENRAHLRNYRGRRASQDEETHSEELEDRRLSSRGRCGAVAVAATVVCGVSRPRSSRSRS